LDQEAASYRHFSSFHCRRNQFPTNSIAVRPRGKPGIIEAEMLGGMVDDRASGPQA
jgi:hypothetical protein